MVAEELVVRMRVLLTDAYVIFSSHPPWPTAYEQWKRRYEKLLDDLNTANGGA